MLTVFPYAYVYKISWLFESYENTVASPTTVPGEITYPALYVETEALLKWFSGVLPLLTLIDVVELTTRERTLTTSLPISNLSPGLIPILLSRFIMVSVDDKPIWSILICTVGVVVSVLLRAVSPTVKISNNSYPVPFSVIVTEVTLPSAETTIFAFAPDPLPPESAISL